MSFKTAFFDELVPLEKFGFNISSWSSTTLYNDGGLLMHDLYKGLPFLQDGDKTMQEVLEKGVEKKYWATNESCKEVDMAEFSRYLKTKEGKAFLLMINRRRLVDAKSTSTITGADAALCWALSIQHDEFVKRERSIWLTHEPYLAPEKVIQLQRELSPGSDFKELCDADKRKKCLALHRQIVPDAPANNAVITEAIKQFGVGVEIAHQFQYLDTPKVTDLKNWVSLKIDQLTRSSPVNRSLLKNLVAIAECLQLPVLNRVIEVLHREGLPRKRVEEQGDRGEASNRAIRRRVVLNRDQADFVEPAAGDQANTIYPTINPTTPTIYPTTSTFCATISTS